MPEGLKLHDQQAYQALCALYRRYGRKEISKDEATRQKRLILSAWEKAKEADAFADAQCSHWVASIRATEQGSILVRQALKNDDMEALKAASEALVKATEGVVFDGQGTV